MKKILVALLALMMIFTFAACGESQEQTGLDGVDQNEITKDYVSDSNLQPDPDEPRYTSDGELIVEEPLPASDSDLTEE